MLSMCVYDPCNQDAEWRRHVIPRSFQYYYERDHPPYLSSNYLYKEKALDVLTFHSFIAARP